MVLLYSKTITSRLKYSAGFVFKSVLGTEVVYTSNFEEYKGFLGAKVNYSSTNADGLNIVPHTLLFENDVRPMEVPVQEGALPFLFPTNTEGAFSFDIFAATFYLISRYEEYLSFAPDRFGRFQPQDSIAYRYNFLEIPIVDKWCKMLSESIQTLYPQTVFPERRYRFIPTIDVDIAWAYKHRGLTRNLGSFAKAVYNLNFKDFKYRFQTIFLGRKDPYYTFDLIDSWHSEFQVSPLYFFHVGKYGKHDKNISPSKHALQRLIKQIAAKHTVGAHPSYRAYSSVYHLKKEIATLARIKNSEVVCSRQHFLMLNLPDTYRNLVQLGVVEDYTMGYASLPGFRAGTCTPFHFFDLLTNEETSLTIVPFQIMDGTLRHYQKLSPLTATETIERIVQEVRNVNGTFVSLWHNDALSELSTWKYWREVYLILLKQAKE